MEHFIRLAKRGRPRTGASGGELKARRLALAVINNVPGLDDEAVAGLIEFLRGVQHDPQLAAKLIGARDEELQPV